MNSFKGQVYNQTMNNKAAINIAHFSDLLCIWAYISQIRVDELKKQFGDQIQIDYHFCSVFGATEDKFEKSWKEKGGVEAYNRHVLSIAEKYPHIEVNKDIWLINRPSTSLNAHAVIKAVQLIQAENNEGLALENFMWNVRLAFFRDAQDISDLTVLMKLVEQAGYAREKVEEKLNKGQAFAALDLDSQLRDEYRVSGSPTLIFNEGSQMLYGNVGFRVIEANVRELLNQPEHQASWC